MSSSEESIREALDLLQLSRAEDLSIQSTQDAINGSEAVKVNPLFEANFWDAHHLIRGLISAELKKPHGILPGQKRIVNPPHSPHPELIDKGNHSCSKCKSKVVNNSCQCNLASW